jgi:hypothetical protein
LIKLEIFDKIKRKNYVLYPLAFPPEQVFSRERKDFNFLGPLDYKEERRLVP